jgi:hypothetical protein
MFVSKKASESLLIQALGYHDKDLQMPPPKDGVKRKLPDAQINDFATWINLGAPLPSEKSVVANGPHWAFQPLGNPAPPPNPGDWAKTEVDAFIAAKLKSAGLQPSPPADKRTLIRRATFDLTGLPPTAEEVQAFQRTTHRRTHLPRSWIACSPHPGMANVGAGIGWTSRAIRTPKATSTVGRSGFFVHAHTYRDWVVSALNADLPYDRFLLLQIAADQLVPRDSPDLAAMGFLTGGRRFLGVNHEIIDDRIDVVTRGTMALTVQCARCHDHKFDPIPTRDYYALYGIFQSNSEQLVCIESEPAAGCDIRRV